MYPPSAEFYRQAWNDVRHQPEVPGSRDYVFQKMARYCRAIACRFRKPVPSSSRNYVEDFWICL